MQRVDDNTKFEVETTKEHIQLVFHRSNGKGYSADQRVNFPRTHMSQVITALNAPKSEKVQLDTTTSLEMTLSANRKALTLLLRQKNQEEEVASFPVNAIPPIVQALTA